jgi:hypothetical protein
MLVLIRTKGSCLAKTVMKMFETGEGDDYLFFSDQSPFQLRCDRIFVEIAVTVSLSSVTCLI